MPDASPSPLSNVQINVTQKHIDDGTPQSCRFCPIALAISEQLREPFFVQVGETIARVYRKITLPDDPPLNAFRIYLPPEATRFIKFFDNDNDSLIQPFSFQIEIPQEYLKNAT